MEALFCSHLGENRVLGGWAGSTGTATESFRNAQAALLQVGRAGVAFRPLLLRGLRGKGSWGDSSHWASSSHLRGHSGPCPPRGKSGLCQENDMLEGEPLSAENLAEAAVNVQNVTRRNQPFCQMFSSRFSFSELATDLLEATNLRKVS